MVPLRCGIGWEEEDRMIALSVSVEGAAGLTWPRWKEWVAAAERWGLAGLFVSDHLVGPFPPDPPSPTPRIAPSAFMSARWSRRSRSATR